MAASATYHMISGSAITCASRVATVTEKLMTLGIQAVLPFNQVVEISARAPVLAGRTLAGVHIFRLEYALRHAKPLDELSYLASLYHYVGMMFLTAGVLKNDLFGCMDFLPQRAV